MCASACGYVRFFGMISKRTQVAVHESGDLVAVASHKVCVCVCVCSVCVYVCLYMLVS